MSLLSLASVECTLLGMHALHVLHMHVCLTLSVCPEWVCLHVHLFEVTN